MAGGWVYFMTNRRNGVIFVGVTSNLPRGAYEHRGRTSSSRSTKHHGLEAISLCRKPLEDIQYPIQPATTIDPLAPRLEGATASTVQTLN